MYCKAEKGVSLRYHGGASDFLPIPWYRKDTFNGPDLSFLLVPLLLGACIFPVVASVMFVRRRTLWLAWWSLGLETVGAVMLRYAVAELNAQAFGPLTALAVFCIVGVAWILPNAAVFNKQWAKLAEARSRQRWKNEKAGSQ